MRLLNSVSGKLHEFLGSEVPNYAILSHTWGDDEVLFNDIEQGTASKKRGYDKVANCRRKAVEDGLDWVWIDTCCIDKSSSAELSEAINSMYQWYAGSSVCYVHLADVKFGPEHSPLSDVISVKPSRWFTRGWTLQELIAPRYIKFYTSDWVDIGTKTSLANHISIVSRIPVPILRGQNPSHCKVAERMSWAASRQTSRVEDKAYCLLGLFGVNMPLLYGEGARSFVRLQEQIMRQEEDYSIFTWVASRQPPHQMRGLLASSPAEFADARSFNLNPLDERREISMLDELLNQKQLVDETRDKSFTWKAPVPGIEMFEIIQITSHMDVVNHKFDHSPTGFVPQDPPEQTSRGLRISLPIMESAHPFIHLAWIQCEFRDRLVCVPLRIMTTSKYDLSYRFSPRWLVSVHKSLLSEFKLQQRIFHPYEDCSRVFGPDISGLAPGRVRVCFEDPKLHAVSFWPPFSIGENQFPFNTGPESHVIAVICCEDRTQRVPNRFRVSFGIVNNIPWCELQDGDDATGRDLRPIWDSYSRMMPEYSYKLGDRAVRRCLQSPKALIAASIHRDMKAPKADNIYVVYVGLYSPEAS